MRPVSDILCGSAALKNKLPPPSFTIMPNCGGATKPRGPHKSKQKELIAIVQSGDDNKTCVASGKELVLAQAMLDEGGFWWLDEVLDFFKQNADFNQYIDDKAEARRLLQRFIIAHCYFVEESRGVYKEICGVKMKSILR